MLMFAQAPAITYTTPHVYAINKTITPLLPKNTGGAVPATGYGLVSTLAGTGKPGSGNGPVLTATFNQPRDAAPDAFGNVYLVDDGNIVRKITSAGLVVTFAGNGKIGFKDGVGAAASFSNPTNIAVDLSGNVYVADNNNNAIRKITPNGTVSTIAGNGGRGFADGKGAAAQFDTPSGITVDASGVIYVADQFNNRIRKIDQAGVVTTVAGNGSYGASDGQGAAASFSQPLDVTTDAAGNLYVVDSGNNKIRKITPAGLVTTFAGKGSASFADGTGTAAAFAFPMAITADKAGNLYVADAIYNQRIRKITPARVVTTLAGNGNVGFDNGIGTAASFSYPYGIGIDNNGDLYIADNQNEAYRKISTSGYFIDKQLPPGLTFDVFTGIISGKPTQPWPATNYKITAYNGSGSSNAVVNIQVVLSVPLKPSVIDFPPPVILRIDADNILHPDATSTNTETLITYTSSNPAVAYVGTDGQIHVISPGITIITAHQQGNENYDDAQPVSETYTIMQDQAIAFQALAAKNICSADFAAGAVSSNSTIPLTYLSSNIAVATVSATGNIHVLGSGSTTIQVSQAGNNLYNAATPVSQVLTVVALAVPSVKITQDFFHSCDGLSLTYTTIATNEGSNPTYQWQLNGVNSGNNSDSYTSSTLKTGDQLTCVVTNNDNCTPVSSPVSKSASLSADPYVTTSVSITSSASGDITLGTPITFKATPSANVQGIPEYTWQVNGQPAGTNSAEFTSQQLSDGDVVTCIILSGGGCVINPTAISNSITVSIVAQSSSSVLVPNAFTPNGDGANDVWRITDLTPLPNCTVNIYNRYGSNVFTSIGYQRPWDGSKNGQPLPSGTYYYVIDLKNGGSKLSGPVTIIR